MEQSVSRFRSHSSRAVRFVVLAAILVASLFVGTKIGTGVAVGYQILQKAYLSHTLDRVQDRARDLTVRIETYHKTPFGTYGGRATGIVIKPGKNGKGRILTNGHVCDVTSILPAPDKFFEMSEKDSLYLPVEGSALFFDAVSVPLNKILVHRVWPDACVLELKGPSPTKDYAEFELDLPDAQELLVVVGHPGGEIKLSQRGANGGSVTTGAPARRFSPNFLKENQRLKDERNEILEKLRRHQFVIDLFSVIGKPQMLKEVSELQMAMMMLELSLFINELQQDALEAPSIGISLSVNVWTIGGASGSGVWNADGKVVAMIWGGPARGGNIAVCVTPKGLQVVLSKLPE